ncbi:HAD family hydrolase [Clostridium sp.]|uniref:HAD family hydrolase n=1 Tax=Clostridium sp. TaxID=1506 RepID=UPI003F3634A6
MKNYKGVVFFDVDGTLIDCFKGIKSPSDKTKEAINKLKENGYLTMLATGRPKSCIDSGIVDLGLHGYIACNGSYADLDEEVLFDYNIENNKLNEILTLLEENNIDYLLEGKEKSYISSYDAKELMDLLSQANISKDSITDTWDKSNVRCNKIIGHLNNEEVYRDIIEKYEGDFAFMVHPSRISFEMYVSAYTKGYGVEQLIEKLDIDRENTYAFGDGENDIEMFQAVKHGIAMGDYHDRLKEHAYDFTHNVENEGIYEGLKKLGLI